MFPFIVILNTWLTLSTGSMKNLITILSTDILDPITSE